MEFMEYDQLLPFLTPDKKAFFVTCADCVSSGDGTGIVHSAPAFGEDDYETGRRYDLPLLNRVNEDGKFVGTPWEGQSVMDADLEIIDYLFKNGLAFKKQTVEHIE